MKNSVWRPWARVVAYIDIILSILAFFVVIYLIKNAYYAFTAMDSDEKDPELKNLIIILWILVATYGLLVCTNFWAAIMLHIATTLGSDPSKALQKARIYRNVLIVFFIFTSACGIYASNWLVLILTGIIRISFIFTICKFIQELQQVPRNALINTQQEENA